MEDTNLNETLVKDMKHRFVKSFLDMLILKLIQNEPIWGYRILKKIENLYQIKLRHGALYPLLSSLETNGFIKSKKELQKGRIRKIYRITPKGTQLLKTYENFLKQPLPEHQSKRTEKSR